MKNTHSPKPETCMLCDRRVALTFHHLIPQKVHRRTRFKKQLTQTERQSGIWICRACHNGLHRFYDEMTLATRFNTLDKIIADEKLLRHIQWVAKQKSR